MAAQTASSITNSLWNPQKKKKIRKSLTTNPRAKNVKQAKRQLCLLFDV
jgi:hypothetical protein